MTQRPATPIDPQRLQLNAALSDPEGWSVQPTAWGLWHRSGLLLGVGIQKDTSAGDGDESVYYTEISLSHTIEEMEWALSDPATDGFSPGRFVPSTTTQKIPVCRYVADDILAQFPWQMSKSMELLDEALRVFQQVLRLNCTETGMAMLERTHQELAAQILQANPEASGKWQVDISRKEAYAEAHTSPSYCTFSSWSSDALLAVGLPIHQGRRSQGVEVTPFMAITMPSTAHARAALLRRR